MSHMFYRFKLPSKPKPVWATLVDQGLQSSDLQRLLLNASDRLKFHSAVLPPNANEFEINYNDTFSLEEGSVLLPPVDDSNCPMVWAAGLNYKKHAEETGMDIPRYPTLFVKSPMTLNQPLGYVVKPKVCADELDFEGELAIIIGKTGKDISVDDALDHVLGFCVANDISARKWQGKKGGGQWCRSKSYDGFLPLGPGLLPPSALNMESAIKTIVKLGNTGKTIATQNSKLSDMIFSPKELISFISQDTTLKRGTVIITGTPEGVGFTRSPPLYLQVGDEVTVSIDGIGSITNTIASSEDEWQSVSGLIDVVATSL